jgi:pterin-4a-carbinolamine dehydratase
MFAGLQMLPEPVRSSIIGMFGTEDMQRLAAWAEAFSHHLMQTTTPPPSPAPGPTFSIDFLTTMSQATVDFRTLSWNQLQASHNAITKAIKAADWKEAVAVGMSLAGTPA